MPSVSWGWVRVNTGLLQQALKKSCDFISSLEPQIYILLTLQVIFTNSVTGILKLCNMVTILFYPTLIILFLGRDIKIQD